MGRRWNYAVRFRYSSSLQYHFTKQISRIFMIGPLLLHEHFKDRLLHQQIPLASSQRRERTWRIMRFGSLE